MGVRSFEAGIVIQEWGILKGFNFFLGLSDVWNPQVSERSQGVLKLNQIKLIVFQFFLMKRTLLVTVFLLFLLKFGYSQSQEYIVRGDTAYSEGKIIFDPSKPGELRFTDIKSGLQKYGPDQVTEFGYKDGRRFVSRKIPCKLP